MSPKDAEGLTPSISDVTLFGNTVFADDQVKVRSLGWTLMHHDCVLIKRGNLDTETHMYAGGTPWGGWHYATQAKEPPEAKREAWNRSFPGAFRGPCQTP